MSASSELASLTLTINGLVVGAGQTIRVQELRGLDDMPDLRTTDSPIPQGDGEDFGPDYLTKRVVEADLFARGTSTRLATILTSLRTALAGGDGTLLVAGMPGLPTLQLTGRVRRRKIPTNTDLSLGVVRSTFDFECPDPTLYDAVETVLTTGPGATVGSGITPPLTPPITPGGSATGGLVTATNNGLRDTGPVIRVAGPVSSFRLLNATTGKTLTYGQAIAAGHYVDIDMAHRTVLLDGTASRRNVMSGSWWTLPPGSSDVYYLPTDAAVGSLMTVRFRSAY